MKLDPIQLLAGQAERQVEQTSAAVDLAFGMALYALDAGDTIAFSAKDLKDFVTKFKTTRSTNEVGDWTIRIVER